MAKLFAGTSGFAYPAWKPGFYPAKLPQKQFLKHYATRLNCVEINYTFRRLPSASTLASWVEASPAGFVFAVKANMRITHICRLKNAGEATELFFKMIDPLRTSRRLGPVLFQIPPAMKCDLALLRDFLELLPKDMRHAFEVRHASWLVDEVYEELRTQRVVVRRNRSGWRFRSDHGRFCLLPIAQAGLLRGGRGCIRGARTRVARGGPRRVRDVQA